MDTGSLPLTAVATLLSSLQEAMTATKSFIHYQPTGSKTTSVAFDRVAQINFG
jgi:hypothetical protein